MIPLSRIKTHLRLDHNEDDAYLSSLISVAVEAFNNHAGRELQAKGTDLSGETEGHNKLEITEGIIHGCLLLIGHWYENRESIITGTTVSKIPFATDLLWSPYKWYAL